MSKIVTIEKKSQREKVLDYLMTGNDITNDKAMSLFQIRRLSAIIHRLRQDGLKVQKVWKQSFSGSRYASYTLPCRNTL